MTNSRQTEQLNMFAQEKLDKLESLQRRRVLHPTERGMASSAMRDGHMVLSFCDNDYLGLSQHPRVIAAAGASAIRHGAGSGGSRLICGDSPLNHELESLISQIKGMEATRLFGSGYLANIALAPALVGRGDIIVMDELSHACMHAGATLSGAEIRVFRHNDVDHARSLLVDNRPEGSRALLMTETVFSMDGDLAPLEALGELCDAHDAWMMTDDAHGFGIIKQANPAPIQMGTLSKAAGVYGGYVSGPAKLMDLFITRARPFVFHTGLPPQVLGAAIESLKVMRDEPQLAQAAMNNARNFCRIVGLPDPQSTIVPVIIGGEEETMALMQKLLDAGYHVAGIRPPTVPVGTSRLRVTFSAAHEEEDVVGLAETLRSLLNEIRTDMQVV
ncbi:MAG: 8-amino-7-oxononanoate synthase [Hirschia sp.]|nr:8-amino-7-oxononanoate synthase [Hirschia sp.]MBF18520.1 8-amino-7-oxononanoate synthase [Hirschia sp.]